nr:MAG TPA: hypothetical protein [Caudoviricetes sp.]
MPSDEYWYGDPIAVCAYYDAFRFKQQQQNEFAWLNGLYVYNAVSVVVGNALSGRGRKKQEYISKPIDLLAEKRKRESPAERAEKERQKAIAYFNDLERVWRERHKTE